eukprot:TRINITY_DN2202_c0_g1_i2.p1 TRINITY_DN2202_c0_g1~~TRINITY_DN2202_c0_g1_i2.p1  ORF type:complete len:158 (-),score=46.84 TRINITY_DN2202_c0_g1_i2:148-621(-)
MSLQRRLAQLASESEADSARVDDEFDFGTEDWWNPGGISDEEGYAPSCPCDSDDDDDEPADREDDLPTGGGWNSGVGDQEEADWWNPGGISDQEEGYAPRCPCGEDDDDDEDEFRLPASAGVDDAEDEFLHQGSDLDWWPDGMSDCEEGYAPDCQCD